MYVKSFVDPEGAGTYISDEVVDNYPPMVAIEHDQALLNISTKDFSFVAEHHISYLFNFIAELRLQVNLMQNTAISFIICVNDTENRVDRLIEKVSDRFKVMTDRDLELITVRHYHKDVLSNLRRGKICDVGRTTKEYRSDGGEKCSSNDSKSRQGRLKNKPTIWPTK